METRMTRIPRESLGCGFRSGNRRGRIGPSLERGSAIPARKTAARPRHTATSVENGWRESDRGGGSAHGN